jgi:hypothetical protein
LPSSLRFKAELSRRAAALGWAIESYAASLLEEAVHLPSGGNPQAVAKERAKAAAERVRELRRGGSRWRLAIRELIDEGRP